MSTKNFKPAAFYRCDGFRTIAVDENGCMRNGDEYSAEIFAERLAKKEFGKSGRVGAFRLDSYTENHSVATYSAFIGAPAFGGGISGRNVFITVEFERA